MKRKTSIKTRLQVLPALFVLLCTLAAPLIHIAPAAAASTTNCENDVLNANETASIFAACLAADGSTFSKMTPDQQVQSYLLANALSWCMVRTGPVSPDDVSTGRLFHAVTLTAPSVIPTTVGIGTYMTQTTAPAGAGGHTGTIDCDTGTNDSDLGKTWISKAEAMWGWTSYVQMVCDMGATRKNGGNCTDANGGNFIYPGSVNTTSSQKEAARKAILTKIQAKAYGGNSIGLTAVQNYALYYGSFVNPGACQGKLLSPVASASPDITNRTDIVPIQDISASGDVVPSFYTLPTPDGSTDTQFLGVYDQTGRDIVEDDCRAVAGMINDTYAPAYAAYVKFSLQDSTIPSATLGNGGCAGGDTDGSNGNCADDTSDSFDCSAGGLSWLVCPVITLGVTAAQWFDNTIMNTLDIDVSQVFDYTDQKGTPGNGYYTAWNSFRIVAMALLIIAGLVMVASQALGLELLDAYTIRKVLPRLLVAIIGISLSWPLMRLVVSFFDTAGIDIREIIYAPFKTFGSGVNLNVGIWTTLGAGAAVFALGFASLTFIITIVVAGFVGFATLVLRQVFLIILIVMAPVAIACSILPNTQRAWTLWRENFLGLMLAFPLISAAIAASNVFAAVAVATGPASGASLTTQAMGLVAHFTGHGFALTMMAAANNLGSNVASAAALIVKFGVFFYIKDLIGMANKALGVAGGFVANATKGVQGWAAKTRSNAAAKNMHDMATGNRFKGTGKIARGVNAATRNIANLPSAGINPLRMQSRMQGAAASRGGRELAEYMEKNEAFAAIKGNDDYLQATMKNMGGGEEESDWRRYLQGMGYEGRSVEQGVALIRAAKRDVSNDTFNKAAVVANASTGTGWKQGGASKMLESIMGAAGGDRHTAVNMLAQMRGAATQAGRVDLAGSGFGTQSLALNNMYDDVEEGTQLNMDAYNSSMYDNAIFTKGPGDYIRARGDAMKNIAPEMLDHLRRSHANLDAARQIEKGTGNAKPRENAERVLAQDYAALENIHDQLSYAAPENARILADTVLSQVAGTGPDGKPMTALDVMHKLSSSDDSFGKAYRETRRGFNQQVDKDHLLTGQEPK